MTTPPVYFECRNITYHYPKTDRLIFKDLNCRLGPHGFHGLFGASGVGKSTLAEIIAGEIPEKIVKEIAKAPLWEINAILPWLTFPGPKLALSFEGVYT